LLISECSLALIEHLQKGGSLRKLAGRDIDKVKGLYPSFNKETGTRSVAFKFDQGAEKVEGGVQTDGQI